MWNKLKDQSKDNWIRVRGIINSLGYNVAPDGVTITMASRKMTPKQLLASRATAKNKLRKANGQPVQCKLFDKTGMPNRSITNKAARPEDYTPPDRVDTHWNAIQEFQGKLMLLPIWADYYGVQYTGMVEAIVLKLRKINGVTPTNKELGFSCHQLHSEIAERIVRRYASRMGNGLRGTKRRDNHDQSERLRIGAEMCVLPGLTQKDNLNPLTTIWEGGTVAVEDVLEYVDQTEADYDALQKQAATIRRFRVIGRQ